MSAIFVSGAGTDIGKTHFVCALIAALRARGQEVDAYKPVMSGFDPEYFQLSDAARLLAALGEEVLPHNFDRVAPRRFAARLAAPLAAEREGAALDYQDLRNDAEKKIAARQGNLIIEGAGGLMSPLSFTRTNLDLIIDLQIPTLLVCGAYLGGVSHALTALAAARAQNALVLALVLNGHEAEEALHDTERLLRPHLGQTPLFSYAHDPAAAASAVADLMIA